MDIIYDARSPAKGVRVLPSPKSPFPKGLTAAQSKRWHKTGESPLGFRDREAKPGPRSRAKKRGASTAFGLCPSNSTSEYESKKLEKEVEDLSRWHRKYILTGNCHRHEYLLKKALLVSICGTKHKKLAESLP